MSAPRDLLVISDVSLPSHMSFCNAPYPSHIQYMDGLFVIRFALCIKMDEFW